MSSRVFGTKYPRRGSLMKGQGLGGELGLLRRQIDEAFEEIENGQVYPQILAVHSNIKDKTDTTREGIGHDTDTLITVKGSGFELGLGRDRYTHIDAAGANASFDVYAMNPGDTGLVLAFEVTDADPGTVDWDEDTQTATVKLSSSNSGNTANALKALLDADEDVSLRMVVIPRGNGTGVVTGTSAFSCTLVGGGVEKSAQIGSGATNYFHFVTKESGHKKFSYQLISGTSLSVKLVDNVLKCYFVASTTTTNALRAAVIAAYPDLFDLWVLGTGAGTLGSGLANAAPVAFADAPDNPAEVEFGLQVAGMDCYALSGNYSAAPSDTALIFKVDYATDLAALITALSLVDYDLLQVNMLLGATTIIPVSQFPLVDDK